MHVDANNLNFTRGQVHRFAHILRTTLEKDATAFSQRPKGNLPFVEIIRWCDGWQRHDEQSEQSYRFALLPNASVHLSNILRCIVSAVKRLGDSSALATLLADRQVGSHRRAEAVDDQYRFVVTIRDIWHQEN